MATMTDSIVGAIGLFIAIGAAAMETSAPWAAEGPAPEVVLFAPGTVSTLDDDAHVTFSPDGRRLYFVKNSPDFRHWTLVAVDWTGGGWGEPEVVPFSGQYADADLSFAPDGTTAYFVSNRPLAAGAEPRADTEIWRLRVDEIGALSDPEHVVELASDGAEWFPNATADGWLYFGSERRDGNRGAEGTSDLWRARLVDGRFTAPENLGPAINTAGQDIEPWVSADGRLMIFASNGRPDTRGSYDLYVSHLCGTAWSEPRNLGDSVNSANWDFGPRLSPDGSMLFVTSNRGFTDRPLERRLTFDELTEAIRGPGNGLRDVYRIETGALDLASPCSAGASASGEAAPFPQLVPVDQAAERADFFAFRARLANAVARRDAVLAAVDPAIVNNFGGDNGIAAFRRIWRLEEADSPLWAELGAILALGGTFEDDGTFVAPYTFSRWPDDYDAFEHVVLVGDGVPVREAPRPGAAILSTMSFALLQLPRGGQPADAASWTAVRLDGNRVGYVPLDLARSPIGYRAIFALRDAEWHLVVLVAGD